MSNNMLAPGAGQLPAASPDDDKAVQPGSTSSAPQASPPGATPPLAMAPPGLGDMQKYFTSQEDKMAQQYGKMKQAVGALQVMRNGWDKLAALGDTITADAVIDVAGDMVAGGIPAVRLAGLLADMPEQSAQLQQWVAQQSQELAPKEAQAEKALVAARYSLGMAAFQSMLSHGAEEHFARKRFAEMPVQGNA